MFVLGVLCLAIIGCQAQPRSASTGPSSVPASTDPLVWPPGERYIVDRQQSELRAIVYPVGPLARLGHPHVVGGPVIDGQLVVAEPWQNSVLELIIDVQALEVDRPTWRQDEGFNPGLSESAVEGTRSNLLSSAVLNAEQFQEIRIESMGISGPRWQPDIRTRVTLRGQAREIIIPVSLHWQENMIHAAGQFALRQSEFGIEPFRAAGGSLSVTDTITIRFSLFAYATP